MQILAYSYVTLSFTFFIDILHLCRIDLWMLPRLSHFLTCHNDVIAAGQNNRLFAPCTDMDRERLRLSYMQNGTYYLQINTWAFPIWKCPCIKLFITYFRHLEKRQPYWPETKSRPILARANMGLDMEMIL